MTETQHKSPLLPVNSITVKGQLIKMQLMVATIVLFVCSFTFIVHDIFLLRKNLENSLHSTGRVLGQNLIPTASFMDAEHAKKILSSLAAEPAVTAAYLFTPDRKVFAFYGPEFVGALSWPKFVGSHSVYRNDRLEWYYELTDDKNVIATLLLIGNTNALNQEYRSYGMIVVGVLIAGILLSWALASHMQRAFSAPMVAMVELVKKISHSGDYSLRVRSFTPSIAIEEIRDLSYQFDLMIERIQSRDRMITEVNQDLEKKVEARTKELKEAQQIAVQNAHAAGMSEISTGILHNIGNIVNSANVSLDEISHVLRNFKIGGLVRINELIERHKSNLGEFFTVDSSGKLVPEYLRQVAEMFRADHKKLQYETENLLKKVNLIKDVVGTQQTYARGDLMKEEIELPTLISDILEMQKSALARHHIQVITQIGSLPVVIAQRVKLSHILLNLLKNAKEAMDRVEIGKRVLRIESEHDEKKGIVYLRVIDSGEGIPAENLNKVFNHSFTTKKNGHGFGLHFCANAMKEMGGDLQAHSLGIGHGATFTMIFRVKENIKHQTQAA